MSRRKSKPSVEIIPGYTAKQSQFIRGEITVDELDGRFFRCFLKNAIAANDEYYIETAKNLLEHFKEESKTFFSNSFPTNSFFDKSLILHN